MNATHADSPPFTGRRREMETVAHFVDDVRGGHGGALVLAGETGVGKTRILHRLTESHPSALFLPCFGVESEMPLAWAGLHQVCAPLLALLPRIPNPQRAALKAAFGQGGAGRPNPFLCGIGVLSLLRERAQEDPLICLVDDASAVDRESLAALGFVARRVGGERIGIVFSVREVPDSLARIPVLPVPPMGARDARALLDSVMHIGIDPAVRDRILAETRGNPRAIVESSETSRIRGLRGGYDVTVGVAGLKAVEASLLDTFRSSNRETRQLLVLAAAEPTGDAALLHRAAQASGIVVSGAQESRVDRLITFEPGVRFRHPLVRSAIYAAASDDDRRAAHRALARAYDAGVDEDRRAWHLAQSLDAPDDDVALLLERSAIAARERGGWAGAAAFLERSARLTTDAESRARRELDAARASFQSGDTERAMTLLDVARTRSSDIRLLADAQLLRGQLTLYLTRGEDGPALLLDAARALRSCDPELSSETYLEAVQAAGFAGSPASGITVGSIARTALAEAPEVRPARPVDLLRHAMSVFYAEGAAAAATLAREANEALLAEPASAECARWITLGTNLAFDTFDDELITRLAERSVGIARQTGMLSLFVMAGWQLVGARVVTGELDRAQALLDEVISIANDVGASPPQFAVLGIHAWRGRIDGYEELASDARLSAEDTNEGHAARFLDGIGALLFNGLGQHGRALESCLRMLADDNLTYGIVVAFEYAEAASKAGSAEETAAALAYLEALTSSAATGWSRGLRWIGRALLDGTRPCDEAFLNAIAEFEATGLRPYVGRVHLLYGERLCRDGRGQEGHAQLSLAFEILSAIGCEGFASRAIRHVTADAAPSRETRSAGDLTRKETQIARLAAQGLSNRQIAEQLFLSQRTVASHLYRAFPKLGVTSRGQLHVALESR